ASRRERAASLSPGWKTCSNCTTARTPHGGPWCASTRCRSNWSRRSASQSPADPASPPVTSTSTGGVGRRTHFCWSSTCSGGRRSVGPDERVKAHGIAEVLRWLAEVVHADPQRNVLVTDNLNARNPGCLFEAFAPDRARRIARRLDWPYTPRHGSWLNVAECELSALSRQCLDRRIGSVDCLRGAVSAWEDDRNERMVGVNWRFTTAQARIR